MANLTLAIDDDLLKRARMRAVEQGTSVNAVVREQLERYAGGDTVHAAMREFLEIAERSQASSGPEGRGWTRESLYDR
jgi:plasmid stability protein